MVTAAATLVRAARAVVTAVALAAARELAASNAAELTAGAPDTIISIGGTKLFD